MKDPILLDLLETPDGHCRGRHYRTGETVRVEWTAGRITSITNEDIQDDSLPWVAPALVDLQVNGYNGVDFQNLGSDPSPDLLKAAEGLRRDGCARALITFITSPWQDLLSRISACRSSCASSPLLQKTFFGWHVEGPFLSSEPGFVGAHDPACIIDPLPAHLEELRAATGADPTLLTLAPERKGASEAISQAARLGMKVSLGHTDASKESIRAAFEIGATSFTHLGNGCPQALDRHDNILWRVLDGGEPTLGVIPDGIHVSPALFRLIHRLTPPNRIYWTTDAMSGAGAPPGTHTLGRVKVEVGEDRIARQPGTKNFAGSALRPLDGVFLGASMLGQHWRDVWDHFSVIPMHYMGQPYGLEVDAPAAFCLLQDQN